MPESRIRSSYNRTVTLWLNTSGDVGVELETTVAELEAYVTELRRHGALDGDKVYAHRKDMLSARLTATLPIREEATDATP